MPNAPESIPIGSLVGFDYSTIAYSADYSVFRELPKTKDNLSSIGMVLSYSLKYEQFFQGIYTNEPEMWVGYVEIYWRGIIIPCRMDHEKFASYVLLG